MLDLTYKDRLYTSSWLWDCGIYDISCGKAATLAIYLDEVSRVALLVDEGDNRVYTITHVTDGEYYALDLDDAEHCYGNDTHHVSDKIAARMTSNLIKKGLLYEVRID